MDAELSQPIRRRRRPPKACEQCRKRKVRCDQNSPCNQCIRLKIDKCTYDPVTLTNRHAKHKKHASVPVYSGAPLTPASTVEVNQGSGSNTQLIQESFSNPQSPFTTNHGNFISAVRTKEYTPTDLLENRLFHMGSRDAIRPPHVLNPTISGNLQGTITKTRLLGRSHWMNATQELDFIFQLQASFENGSYPEIIALFHRCKILGRNIKSQTLAKLKTRESVRDHVPGRAVADDLVEKYFRIGESCYRILHIPSFWKEYEKFWTAPEQASTAFVVKLLLVLAIGTCLCDEQSFHEYHMLALQWINAAQSWLTCPFTEKSKLSVTGIQIYCLLLVARESSAVGPDLVWISAGSLLRMAMLTGLHRDPSHFKRISPFQREIRRRLWVTVMEICLQSSMNAGGLPIVSPEMHDCLPPLNLDDNDLTEDMSSDPVPADDNTITDCSLQIALLQTISLRCQIATMLNDFRSEESFAQTLQLDTSLSKSLYDILSRLRTSQSRRGETLGNAGFRTYEIMSYRFLMSLHQTYAAKALKDPVYYYSRKACLDASLLILQVALPTSESATTEKSDFRRMLEASRGVHRQVMLLAQIIANLELLTQLQNSKSAPVSVMDSALRNEIFRLSEAYTDLSWDQVRLEETNIKGCVCTRVIVQTLRALENGTLDEAAMAAKAQVSLTEAATILQERLDRLSGLTPAMPTNLDDQLGNDFGLPFGDDFGWDDWNPTLDADSMNLFFAQS